MLVSANKKFPQRIDPFPDCLEARNLLRPSRRSPGLSYQPFGVDIGVLVPRQASSAVGEGHSINLASRLSHSGVFPSSDISPRISRHYLRLRADLRAWSASTKVAVGPDGAGLDWELGPRPFSVF